MNARKQTSSRKRVWIIVFSLLLLFILSVGFKIYEDVLASNFNLAEGEKAYVFVGTRLTLEENEKRWKESGIFKKVSTTTRLIRLLGYEKKIKPGRYEVTASTSNYALLKKMAGGTQTPVDVTLKYAERKEDLVHFWSSRLEADSNELSALLGDLSMFEDLGLDSASTITVFIPNTYNFFWNTTAEDLLLRMKKEYQKFWNEERKSKAAQLGFTPAQVTILASVVQKETYQKAEMPVIAGVYYNRLQNGMPFQADPTILFVLNDKSIKRVSGAMLQIESPYNTYKYKGLVPGPICIPSVQAVDAVLNMQHHSYLYFCAREDFSGFHNFASSFAQHQVNARKYQRELNRRGIR